MQVLDVVETYGGCVVVDSTRRGKSMPDALMKTVPVWCAVFNRLLFPDDEEAGRLYTPPKCVSASEHAQIEVRIPGFVASLEELKLDIATLRAKVKKPLRPIWVTRASELPTSPPSFEDFHPIVLCTASRRATGTEVGEGGYIQGAGDDAESWSLGLTSPLFWNHHEELLHAKEDSLPELIAKLVSQEATTPTQGTKAVSVKAAPWLSIGSFAALTTGAAYNYDIIITIGLRDALPPVPIPPRKHIHLQCKPGKLGSRDLRTQLPHLQSSIANLSSRRRVLVCDTEGRDFAPGVALALLCLYADEGGSFPTRTTTTNGANGVNKTRSLDKSFIRQRLSWVMTSLPSASPSRATLQSVNEFLLSGHGHGHEYTKTSTTTSRTSLPASNLDDLNLAANTHSQSSSPAETIFKYLKGKWTLHRTIQNHLPTGGLAGTVTGTATFTSRSPTADNAEGEYLYHEEGVFNAGPGINLTVNRRWIWRLSLSSTAAEDGDGSEKSNRSMRRSMSIHFVKPDGETEDYLYNKLPFLQRDGDAWVVEAEHPCGRDFYVSRYTFYLVNNVLKEWNVRHEVKGPVKDYVSSTVHERA